MVSDVSMTMLLDKLPPDQRSEMEEMVASHGEEFVRKHWTRLRMEIDWASYAFDKVPYKKVP